MQTEARDPAASRAVATATVAVMVAAVIAVAALVVVSLVWPDAGSGRTPAGSATRVAEPAPDRSVPPAARVSLPRAVRAVAVLRRWDDRRAAAWERGDLAALRRLYVAGSPAGSRDVAMLRGWVARGLRVERMRMQVFDVRLRVCTDRRLVLLVTDRLARARAVTTDGSRRWLLPRDRVSTRRLEFRSVGGRWRLATSYERPLASTAVTSASATS